MKTRKFIDNKERNNKAPVVSFILNCTFLFIIYIPTPLPIKLNNLKFYLSTMRMINAKPRAGSNFVNFYKTSKYIWNMMLFRDYSHQTPVITMRFVLLFLRHNGVVVCTTTVKWRRRKPLLTSWDSEEQRNTDRQN